VPISVPVQAADRAGNTATRDITFVVDRVAPSVGMWTSAANGTRMADCQGMLTFVEDVVLASPTDPPVIYVNDGMPVFGQWLGSGHQAFAVNTCARAGRVVELALAPGITDAAGNPVTPVPNRRFHLATAPLLSNDLIATDVSTFAVASDADGVITIAWLATNGRLSITRDVDGQLVTTQTNVFGISVAVNSWNIVNPTTLVATPQFGVTVRSAVASTHLAFANGTLTQLAPTTPGVVVSRTSLSQEPTTTSTGLVLGTNYARGAHTVTLPTPGSVLAQSNDSFVVASIGTNTVSWSKYRCDEDARLFPGPRTWTCAGTAFGSSTGLQADRVELAMNRSGSCLMVNARLPPTNFLTWTMTIPNCDGGLGVNRPAACNSNLNFPTIAGAGIRDARAAPYGLGTTDGILVAHPAFDGNPSHFRLHTMLNCDAPGIVFEPVVVANNVRDFFPAQVGRQRALFFVDTVGQLSVRLKN
jgi:hypothetical protein